MESVDLLQLDLPLLSPIQIPFLSPTGLSLATPWDPEDVASPTEILSIPRKRVDGAGYTRTPQCQPILSAPDIEADCQRESSSSDTLSYALFEDVTQYLSRKSVLEAVPKIQDSHQVARIRWGFFTTYRRLFSLVFLGNVVALIVVLSSHRTLPAVANATAANLAVTGLIRVPYVVNLFYMAICSIPRTAPLPIRHAAAEMPHFGGVHSGCGVAALFWYISLCGITTRDYALSPPPALLHDTGLMVLMYLILCLILFIIIAAHPVLRFKFHDSFELTHRFSSWLLIPLFWAFLIVFAHKQAQGQNISLLLELVSFPAYWFAIMLTVAFFIPWMSLRKVPVESEYLSSHAVRLHFDYATTGFAQGVSVSRHPLRDWHSFAGIPNINGMPGFSLIVSKAGDWTGAVIKEQPQALWTRGIPTSGFGRNCLLFKRILLVTTGSGMGPCLSLLSAANRPPIRIIWQTRSPLKTYGEGVLSMIAMVDKNAVVIDSDKHGRQDMFPIAWDMFKDFNAEAVFIISRPGIVQKLVFEFEARGIPAFGPVFDS
jgi:hypothetical protein